MHTHTVHYFLSTPAHIFSDGAQARRQEKKSTKQAFASERAEQLGVMSRTRQQPGTLTLGV